MPAACPEATSQPALKSPLVPAAFRRHVRRTVFVYDVARVMGAPSAETARQRRDPRARSMDDFSRSSESAASVDETQVPASTVAHSAAAERDRHFERIVLAAGIVDPQSLEASRRHLAASGAQSLAELLVACGLISETARRAIEVLVGVQFAKGGADESTLVQSQSALESTITYAPSTG